MKLKRGNNVNYAFDNISKQKDELDYMFVILGIIYFTILIIRETRLIRSCNFMTKMGIHSRKIKKLLPGAVIPWRLNSPILFHKLTS